jgi:hypothetical protein
VDDGIDGAQVIDPEALNTQTAQAQHVLQANPG